jgi:hypothetical protein
VFGKLGLNKAKPFLVNDHANYNFAELSKMPETQLVMLVSRKDWERLPEYIEGYESITLAGRFGAEAGSYEWEWVAEPEAVRWWRRNATGEPSLFGMAVAIHRGDLVELYGLVEVDENSPHWAEVIPEEAANAMPEQARVTARRTGRTEADVLTELYRDYFRAKRMLTLDASDQPALRRGTVREVERFRDALRVLLARRAKAQLSTDGR